MATTETGHHANRGYFDQDGNFHVNGSSIYLDESGTAFSGTEAAMIEGVTAGVAQASKAVVLDSALPATGQCLPVVTGQATATVTAARSGTIFICAVDAVMTLPAAAAGLEGVYYTFVCGSLSGGTGLSISPNAADNIYGNGLTAVDNKDLINTGATDVVGDSATVVCDGTNWLITNVTGIWAKEA